MSRSVAEKELVNGFHHTIHPSGEAPSCTPPHMSVTPPTHTFVPCDPRKAQDRSRSVSVQFVDLRIICGVRSHVTDTRPIEDANNSNAQDYIYYSSWG